MLHMITWYTESLIFISFFLLRLVKAIENLQHFSLSADPSFRHYQIDVSRELKALSSMDFIQGFYKNVLFYVKYNNKMHMHLNLHLISPLMFCSPIGSCDWHSKDLGLWPAVFVLAPPTGLRPRLALLSGVSEESGWGWSIMGQSLVWRKLRK